MVCICTAYNGSFSECVLKVSQADADAQAENWLLANGQNTANTSGTCLQIFYSPDTTVYFTSQCEEEGYVGTSVAYHLPYGLYTSTIDQTDANQKAFDDIDANGQSYANDHGA